MWRDFAVSGITSGFDSAPPKWLGNSRQGTSAMLRMKAPLLSSKAIDPLPVRIRRNPASSGDDRAAIDVDDRPRRKADGHEGEDLPRDVLPHPDAAGRQRSRRLGKHLT